MKFVVSQSAYDVTFMCAAIALEGTWSCEDPPFSR